MLDLQGRSKNNPCCCYSLFSFCPAERDFVTHSASLNLIRNQKIDWGRQRRSKKIRTASPHAMRPPRIFILPAPERCLLLMKAGFVTRKDLNLFNRCFKPGVGDQLVYSKVATPSRFNKTCKNPRNLIIRSIRDADKKGRNTDDKRISDGILGQRPWHIYRPESTLRKTQDRWGEFRPAKGGRDWCNSPLR